MAVSLLILAATVPNSTAMTLARFVPVIVIFALPETGPDVGLIFVTVGAPTYMNLSFDVTADVPPAVTTRMSTLPAVPAGLVTTIWLPVSLANVSASTVPNITATALARFAPVIVTLVPPVVGPKVGLIFVTVGAATYVYLSASEVFEVPSTVTTVTSTVPAVPAGLVTTICVAVSPVIFAAFLPNMTAVALAKSVPMIVTDVPPFTGPAVRLIPVTIGTATYLNWSADDVADAPSAVSTVTSTVPVPAGLVATIWVSELTVKLLAASAQNPRRSRP